MPDPSTRRIPLWLKIAYTALVGVLAPIYAFEYGWRNFLWFSNVALLLVMPALWLESRLLVSMQAVSVALLEMGWILDFVAGLLLGDSPIGLTAYMFDEQIPFIARFLSLYHVPLPFLLLWLVCRLGLHPRAWMAQTLLAWVILPLAYAEGTPRQNINWVYGPLGEPQQVLPPLVYLGLVMLAFPLLVYLPSHFVIKQMPKIFRGCRGE